MILYELFGDEQHPAHRQLAVDNLARQYDLLDSIVNTAIAVDRPMISTALLTALNYHAIACLHVNAGQYRPCEVTVGDPDRAQAQGLEDPLEGLRTFISRLLMEQVGDA